MVIHTTSNQDTIIKKGKGIVFTFAQKRHVLSSSVLNGGWRDDLCAVFNFDEKPDDSNFCEMTEATYEEHLSSIAKNQLMLDPSICSGLSTAADMENMVIETDSVILSNGFPLTVTAAITGGIDQNGSRPGDPACWEEFDSAYQMLHPGTINIFLHINASLTKGAMVRSIITASEAKAAACTELFCPSLYSEGLATGSGTDGMIIICDPSTPFVLTAAGKDSQLGEMIGKTIIKALKKAIALQTGVTPEYQHHALKRLDRFGLTEDHLYGVYVNQNVSLFLTGSKLLSKEEFLKKAAPLLQSGIWTVKSSMLAHLLDQWNWDMITSDDIKESYSLFFNGECPDNLNKDILLQSFCIEFLSAFSRLS